MYSPKATMLLFPLMFCLRGRRIKSSSTLRKLQKQMLSNLTNKSSKTQSHKTLKIPELSQNSIPFPPSEEPQWKAPDGLETDPVIEPNIGCGHRPHPAPGHYARLNKGLETKLAMAEESNGYNNTLPEEALFAVVGNMSVLLLTDFALGSSMGTETRILDEVLHTPHTKEWRNAYNYKIGQLTKLGTWDLVQLPAGKTLIPHLLVFKEKLSANGNINSWHVQLVASGHRQTYGVNYDETFAMAAKMPSIHVVLGNAAQQDWEIHQVDIKSEYLNVPLEEEVYMVPPAGLLKPGQEQLVRKLKKALYVLKQAGHEWQKMLTAVMINDLGFKCSVVDHLVSFRCSGDEHTIIVAATDDMAITSKWLLDVIKFKSEIR